MPQCRQCNYFDGQQCLAHARAASEYGRPIPPPPIGACTLAIVEAYRELIKPGMRVLEIGCGSWPLLRQICQEQGAQYHAIDTQTEYFGKKSIATRIENLQNLSYEPDSFDLVIGNQSIEHWAEFNCPTAFGLYKCFLVCKPGGMVVMNAPIHFHGSAPFLLGDFEAIRSLFAPFSKSVAIECWGKDSDPIPSYETYTDYGALKGKPAYIIDIRAIKDRPVGRALRIFPLHMKLRRWANYPLSYLIYKIRQKIGLTGG